MLYDELFEKELREYNDNAHRMHDYDELFKKELREYNGNARCMHNYDENVGEKIFPFNNKYECNIQFQYKTIIKSMCINIDVPDGYANIYEFIDQNSHEILTGNIRIGIRKVFSLNIALQNLLLYNIHKYKKGYDVMTNTLRIPICNDICHSIRDADIFEIYIAKDLHFVDHKNMSVSVSIDDVHNYNKKRDISWFLNDISYIIHIDSMYMHNDNKLYYKYVNNQSSRYIYIIANCSENELDYIDRISLHNFNRTYDMQYDDIHKMDIMENTKIIMIDIKCICIDINVVRYVCIYMKNNYDFNQWIDFKLVCMNDDQ